MKLNKILTVCAVAATLCLSASTLLAQNGGGGGGFGGGNGGGGRGGNMTPAQFQQMRVDRVRTQLDLTNDTDWTAIQPLVQKVMDAQQAVGFPGRGGFGGRRGGQGGGGQNTNASVEQQALQNAIDSDAPAAQIKDALDKYEASQKTKQATLAAAQEALRQVLTPKQEAQATLMGLLP
jgi:Spy/CpxP family protein refolding chaperone